MQVEIKHIPEKSKFLASLEGENAEITYDLSQNTIDFLHTFVPEKFRGEGVAEEMARFSLDYARKNNLKVIASCRFVASYIKRHEAYQDLLK